MMMHGAVLLGVMASCVLAQKDVLDTYAYTQLFARCLGEDAYYGQLLKIEEAKKQCKSQPLISFPGHGHTNNVNNINTVIHQGPLLPPQVLYGAPLPHNSPFPNHPSFPTFIQGPVVYNHGRQKRQSGNAVFGREEIEAGIAKLYSAISNFTCILQTIDTIDENLNVRLDLIRSQTNAAPIDSRLKQDIIDGYTACNDFVQCLPVDKKPIPAPIQRLIAFIKCERKARVAACLKQDIRQKLFLYDISALPDDGGRTSVEDKLAMLFVSAGSLEDLKLF